MRELVYLLCAITSLVCTLLLLRAYKRARSPLLLWSSMSFIGLAINSVLLFVDLVLIENIDFSIPRAVTGAVAVTVLVFGLVWTSR